MIQIRNVRRLATLVMGLLLTCSANAAVVYSETFPKGTGSVDEVWLEQTGWFGGHVGDIFAGNVVSGEGAIGRCDAGDDCLAFFSKKNINADLFLYTNEFSFNTSILGSVSFDAVNSNTQEMLLSFLVGNTWYVSETGSRHTTGNGSTIESFIFNPMELTYSTYDLVADGSDFRLGGATGLTGQSLADNVEVSAFGITVTEKLTGTLRIDNFQVSSVSAPSAVALLLLSLVVLRVKRKH